MTLRHVHSAVTQAQLLFVVIGTNDAPVKRLIGLVLVLFVLMLLGLRLIGLVLVLFVLGVG